MTRMIAILFECIKGYSPLPPPAVVCTFELILILVDPRVKTSLHGAYAGQGLQVHAQTFISYAARKFHVIELLRHVKWSYCWTMRRSLHREPSDILLGELQNVIILLTVGLLFCSEGQVQEEMKKLKIINRSGVVIQLAELIAGIQIGEIITIAPDCEHNYPCNRYLDDKSIRLDLSPQHSVDCPCIHLNGDFMDANKIAYVRKGDGDRWFVDPICRGAKLVRKHVRNSTPLQIALAEFVFERKGETVRVPGMIDHELWTAWWEIEMPSRTKKLLIVDPVAVVKQQRKYFGRGGGLPIVGSIPEVDVLRRQNNNVNIHEIKMASHNEHLEVKERSPGLLDWTSSWRPRLLV